MGCADSSQLTTLPSLERAISPASASTRRCFMKPGSDMSCGAASSETARSPPPLSLWRMPRRVGSASAANTASSCRSSVSLSLTMTMPAMSLSILNH